MKYIEGGLLCAIEGIDGCGKTTLAQSLTLALSQLQFPVVLTREPGGTQLGNYIRALLSQRPCLIQEKAEYLLFAADRAQHFDQTILPALHAGAIVIADRLADSSVAYQGYGRGLDRSMLERINTWAMQGQTPDITVYLRIDYETAWLRLVQRTSSLTAFEQEKVEFFKKVIQGFEELYKQCVRVRILDGREDPNIIFTQAFAHILRYIEEHKHIQLVSS